MKKIFFIATIFSVFFGCSKKKQTYSNKIANDSLSYYIKLSEDDNLSEEDKIVFINKAFNIYSNVKNTSANRDSLYSIVYKYYTLKVWDEFDKSSLFLLKRSLESKDSINLPKVYRYRAAYFKNTKSYDSSFYYYLKAEKIYSKLKDDLNYANILYNKGIVQYSISDYFGAELSLSKAYYFLKDSNEKNKLYGTLNQLGLVYSELKDYDKSIDNFKKALATVNENKLQNVEHQKEVCLSNLGLVYLKKKDYKKAIFYFQQSLLDKELKNHTPDLYSNIIDNLGYSKFHLSDKKNLPDLFYEALKIRDSLNSSSVIISCIHLSEYYNKINNLDLAVKYSNKALSLAKKYKSPYDYLFVLQQASIVDAKNASKYSKDYIRISDSLQIIERNSSDRFARIQLETDELRQENFNLLEKNRNILSYFFGTVFFIGVLFLMKNQRSRARLLALKQAQQQANEEIYRLIISHQNQLELGKDLEKKRLSKELHDGVLGRLFGLRLSLDGLNSFDDEQAKKERLEYLNELQLIEQDLREISHELSRETSLLINNFVAIINSLIEQQAKVNNANIKVIIGENIDWDKISNIIKINLYRILQEALQNINKHAGAKNVLVHFRKDTEENLLFNIEDDGKGFDTNIKKNKGIGTKNMVSRVHQCNGSIDIKSEIGKGSKIIIIFPLENSNFKV